MLQRIQTVYLLLITLLCILLLFMPLAIIQSNGNIFSFDSTGLNTLGTPSELVIPTWALMVLASISTLLSIIAVFLYKRRLLQIRFCIFNGLLLVGYMALFGFYVWQNASGSESFHFSPRPALSFPLVALILDYLAIRKIGIDEALVRSLDRLR